ncbi:MAG: AbrB/MazE/SpoVT family DNA-binding domain-containing protein [Chloroflexi bacterium]|nr:AbrB/MazE/SpoVT family DNA-binding domain-containing protein [Chloroflexota bacterium]
MSRDERMTRTVRALRGGQITIPAAFRKELGLTDDSLLQVTLEGDELRLRPVQVTGRRPGSSWLSDLYAYFAPVRAEGEAGGYSEAEINTAIDEALREARDDRAARRL